MKNVFLVNSFRKWVIGAGVFNVVMAFPLAMPFLFQAYYGVINELNNTLGLGGRELKPPIDGANMLLINTAGLALLLVGLILIYGASNLKERMGIPILNGMVRLVFSVTAGYYLVVEDIPRILLFLAAIDVVIAGAFFYHVYKLTITQKTAA